MLSEGEEVMPAGVATREAAPQRAPASRKTGSSMIARIAAHAANQPHEVAVLNESGDLSYGELDRRANQVAAHLRELGAGPDHVIGLLVDRSAQFIVAALGVMKAGAAYLPLDTSTPADRVAYVLDDAGAP